MLEPQTLAYLRQQNQRASSSSLDLARGPILHLWDTMVSSNVTRCSVLSGRIPPPYSCVGAVNWLGIAMMRVALGD